MRKHDLRSKLETKYKFDIQQTTTTTELHAPYLGKGTRRIGQAKLWDKRSTFLELMLVLLLILPF